MRLSVFDPQFREDLAYWIEQDRKLALRILRPVEAVMRDPFAGEGKPEPLKGLLTLLVSFNAKSWYPLEMTLIPRDQRLLVL